MLALKIIGSFTLVTSIVNTVMLKTLIDIEFEKERLAFEESKKKEIIIDFKEKI